MISKDYLKIRDNEHSFKKLSANVPGAICKVVRKPNGTYSVPISSVGIKNVFGCLPEDVIDDFSPLIKFILPEDLEKFMKEIEYSAENLTQLNSECRVQLPGQTIKWVYSKGIPERLSDGSVAWYGFSADVTEQKKTEEDFRKTAEETMKLNKLMIGRELKMIELKKEIEELKKK